MQSYFRDSALASYDPASHRFSCVDPQTGKGAREVDHYVEVRSHNTDVIINLTCRMGGDWVPDDDNPSLPGPGTDMVGPEERLAHVEKLQPEICSSTAVR